MKNVFDQFDEETLKKASNFFDQFDEVITQQKKLNLMFQRFGIHQSHKTLNQRVNQDQQLII